MIKYLIAILMFCTTSIATAEERSYTKIISQWSNQIVKQKHNIVNTNKYNHNSSRKEDHFKILESWKSGIKKINKQNIIGAFYTGVRFHTNKASKQFLKAPYKRAGKRCH